MAEILQKTANPTQNARHRQLIKSGILAPTAFDKHVKVKGYDPSSRLAPYVSHYWVMRWDIPGSDIYRPTEILSRPVIHAFITSEQAFIYGIINGTFDYELRGKGAMAGITFHPGGLYPFLEGGTAMPSGKQTSLETVFPGAASLHGATFLAQTDKHIVASIETALLAKPVQPSQQLELISQIVDTIASDTSLTTVESVAAKFHRSERTLQHIFKTYVGVGIKWVIMRIRLLEAVEQAHLSGKPDWARIAADLGYSSQAHFANDFRSVLGTSPAQFMKSVRQN